MRTLSANPLMDTVLAVHTDGEPLVCNDDHSGRRSKVTFPATADVTYYLQVGHYGGTLLPGDPGPGALQVQVVEQPTPTNDDVTTPEVVSGETGETDVDTTLATHAAGDPSQPTETSHTLWYVWQATSDGVVAFDTRSDDAQPPDTFLYAFPAGGPTTASTALAFNDDVAPANRLSRIAFDVEAGTTYRILVGTRSGHDPFRLGWSEFDPVATTTELQARSPSPYAVQLVSTTTGPSDGTVTFLRDGVVLGRVATDRRRRAAGSLTFQRPGPGTFTAEFYPDDPAFRPSASAPRGLEVDAPETLRPTTSSSTPSTARRPRPFGARHHLRRHRRPRHPGHRAALGRRHDRLVPLGRAGDGSFDVPRHPHPDRASTPCCAPSRARPWRRCGPSTRTTTTRASPPHGWGSRR